MPMMLGRHQARENRDAAGLDNVIVVTATVGGASHLLHGQAPPGRAVFGRELLQDQNPVSQAEDVAVGTFGVAVVEKQSRAVPSGEILFEGKNLAPVAERILRKQPELGERIESASGRP